MRREPSPHAARLTASPPRAAPGRAAPPGAQPAGARALGPAARDGPEPRAKTGHRPPAVRVRDARGAGRGRRRLMRVVAGTARGIPLASPRGAGTRPITDRVKETLFAIVGEQVIDAV